MGESAAARTQTGAGGEVQASFARSAKEPLAVLAIFTGILVLAAAAGTGFALYEGAEINWWIPVIIILALLPAFAIGCYMAWKARTDRSAQVTVSAAGLEIPALTSQPMPWSDISRLSVAEQYYKGSRQSVSLAIFVDDPATLGPRSGRIIQAFNRWYFGTPLAYNLEPLEGEPEEVIAAIRRFAPASLLAASSLGTSEDPGVPCDVEL